MCKLDFPTSQWTLHFYCIPGSDFTPPDPLDEMMKNFTDQQSPRTTAKFHHRTRVTSQKTKLPAPTAQNRGAQIFHHQLSSGTTEQGIFWGAPRWSSWGAFRWFQLWSGPKGKTWRDFVRSQGKLRPQKFEADEKYGKETVEYFLNSEVMCHINIKMFVQSYCTIAHLKKVRKHQADHFALYPKKSTTMRCISDRAIPNFRGFRVFRVTFFVTRCFDLEKIKGKGHPEKITDVLNVLPIGSMGVVNYLPTLIPSKSTKCR